MGTHVKEPKFKINPIEVLILAATFSAVIHSGYQLFFDWKKSSPIAKATPAQDISNPGDRSPAGAIVQEGPLFLTLRLDCKTSAPEVTQASKVRIIGSLCAPSKKVDSAEVENHTNEAVATVFLQNEIGKFTTDYIPLSKGENTIEVRTRQSEHQMVTKTIRVIRE